VTLPRKPARYWGDGDFNALADAIEGVSDSMPITYNQDDPPVPPIPANSVWIDTNDGGRAYVWSGTGWVSLEGPQGPPGSTAQTVTLVASAQSFTYDGAGAALPATQSISFEAVLQNLTGPAEFACTRYDSADVSLGAVTLGAGVGDARTLTHAQFGAAAYAVVTATLGGLTDRMTVVRLQDGAGGVSPIVGYLTNEASVVPASADGTVLGTFDASAGRFEVYEGTTRKTLSGEVTYSVFFESDMDISIASDGWYTIASMSADAGDAVLRAAYGGVTLNKAYKIVKSKAGPGGAAGTNGDRGAGNYHLADTGASAPDDATFASLANGVTPNASTPSGNVFQDRVTIFNNAATPPWSVTKFWDGDSWEALTQYIDGNLLVSGTVAASKMVATEISGGLFTADVLKTTGYDEDGSGNPITGAKLDRTGTALKVAPGSLQTGARALLTMGGGNFTLVGANNIATAEIVELVGGQDSVKLTFSNAFPGYNPDAYFPAGYGDYLLLGGSAVFMMPSRAPVGGYKIELVPEHRRPDYVVFGIHMNGARVNDIYNITTSSFQVRLTVGVIQIW
jgi:hypothetical protein